MFLGNGTKGPYLFSSRPTAFHSDSVWVNGNLRERANDYKIDYDKGYIFFSSPIDDNSKVVITFIPIYFRTENPYHLYKPTPIDLMRSFSADTLPNVSLSEKQKGVFIQPGLKIGGSKSLSFEFGNGITPDISQSLDLSIRGAITNGVEATAYVSDKGTPLTSGGSSGTIEELDKFFVSIATKNLTATLGDFYIDFDDLELAKYNKKLKGVTVAYDDDINRVMFSGASSSGRFTIDKFEGREGDQGPYFLTDAAGSGGISVLPGTERVYIDGEKLMRGSDNDYTIDYSNAYLIFTPKRLITSDSRIEVEYEYADIDYSRNFYSSRLQREIGGDKISFGTTVIGETDDKSNPLNVELSPDDIELIKNSGASEYAYKSGVEDVGADNGEYNRLSDSTGYIYYTYVGPDSGEYKVVFSNVGVGKGDYIYEGRGIYKFVGVGLGEYAPLIRLPIPKSHYLYSIDGKFNPSEKLSFSMETAYSRDNRNLFLGGDAVYDDPGITLKGIYTSKSKDSHSPLDFSLGGDFRHTGKYFKPFAEFRGPDYYNKWNLPIDYTSAVEDMGEAKAVFDLFSKYNFRFEGGRLSRTSQGFSQRWSAGTELKLPFNINYRGDTNNAEYSAGTDAAQTDTSDINKLSESYSELEIDGKVVIPSFSYKYRYKAGYKGYSILNGERYNIYEAGLTVKPYSRISNKISYSLQRDDIFDTRWMRRDDAITLREYVSFSDIPEGLKLNYEYVFRHKFYKEISGTDNRQHLSYLTGSYNNGPFDIDYIHKYNRTRSALKVEHYVKVDEGKGEYRYENGEYIPDPFGDYVRIVEDAGEYVPVSEIDNSVHIRFDGRSMKTSQSSFNKIKLETTIDSNQQTKESGLRLLDIINPWRKTDKSALVNEQLSFVQDIYLFPSLKNRRREIRFRYRQKVNVSAGGTFIGEADDLRSGGIRIKYPLRRTTALKTELSREHRVVSGTSVLRIDSFDILVDVTHLPTSASEVGMGVKFRNDKEHITDFSVQLYSLSPHLRWNATHKSRLDFNGEYVYAHSAKMDYFNYRIAEGNRKGSNYRLTSKGTFKISANSFGEISYNLIKRSGESPRNFVRAEIKYNF